MFYYFLTMYDAVTQPRRQTRGPKWNRKTDD
jgi:hypothetical protein